MTTTEGQATQSRTMRRIEVVLLLQSVELFKFCSAAEVVRIAGISEQCQFAADERIYRANDPANMLYCVVDGEVALENEEGGDSVIIGPRGSFGVLEILSGRLRANHARAASDTVALGIAASDFFDLLSSNVEIVKALFREVLDDRPGSSMM
ncbi:MAG: cyclic nucleotide-binding domain-containing protein [Acidobacteriota bacterium]